MEKVIQLFCRFVTMLLITAFGFAVAAFLSVWALWQVLSETGRVLLGVLG